MPFSDDEELITEAELSRLMKRSPRQLQRDRATRQGIPFLLNGTQVRYRRGDVRSYIASLLVGLTVDAKAESTTPAAAAATVPPRRRSWPSKRQRLQQRTIKAMESVA